MKYEIAKSTGFTILQGSSSYGEALHKILPDPVQDVDYSKAFICKNKEQRIEELTRKSVVSYLVDSMVRQSVDKFAEMFKAFQLTGGDKQVQYLKKRLIQITLQTGEHWETFLTRAITEYFKTGNSFIIKRRGGNVVSGLRPLYKNRPYSLSGFSLVSADRVEPFSDKEGQFVGWKLKGVKTKEKLRLIVNGANKLDNTNALIQISNTTTEENVMLPGADVVQVAYKKPADSNWGFGLTAAALEDVAITRSLEQIMAMMTKKFANPIIHHKILRPSNPLASMAGEIAQTYEIYRRKAPDGVIVTGGNAEIKAIGSESQALRMEGYLKYNLYRTLAGLGVSPYLMGLEGGGQGTAEAAVELLMLKVRYCQTEIARELEMFLFNEILWEGGFDPYTNEEDQVNLTFEEVDEDRKIKLQTHAADMYNKNVLGLKEARKYSGIKKDADENDLYLSKVDMPKIKADAEAKGKAQKDAGVAVAKARPKTRKEMLEEISYFIPESSDQVSIFLNLLERRYNLDANDLLELQEPIKLLIGHNEAILALLTERFMVND